VSAGKTYVCAAIAVAAELLGANPALSLDGGASPATSAAPVPAARAPVAPAPAAAPVAEAALPVMKLNPTKRDIELEVPLKADGALLGNVALKITPEDKLFADAKLLKTYLGKILKQDILNAALAVPAQNATQTAGGTTLAAKKAAGAASSSVLHLASQPQAAAAPEPLGQEPPSYLPLEVLNQRGIDIHYDPQAIALQVAPTMDQRATQHLSFGDSPGVDSSDMARPAEMAGYLNMRATAAYVSQSSSGGTGMDVTTVDLDGAMRFRGAVLESEASFYAGAPAGLTQAYYQDYVFYRHGTRLVYDLPEDAMRIRFGDFAPDITGFQGGPDLLGVSIQQSYKQLQPGKTIRPTGSHSFSIERPSNVDIIIDGVLFKHIRLAPGNYNLSDIPLRAGANDVQLVIMDDTGTRRTLEFKAFSGNDLLAPGVSEWSFSGGIKSYDQGVVQLPGSPGAMPPNVSVVNKSSAYQQRQYYFDRPVATGYYRVGVTTALTVEANTQADERAAMSGAGFATQTVYGLFTGELSASASYSGQAGFAAQLGYGYDRFDWFGPYKSALRLLAEYRSPDYEPVGTFNSAPLYNESVAASYTQKLPYDVSGGLSFSLSHLDSQSAAFAATGGNHWEADLSLSKNLTHEISGSLSLGYGRNTESQNYAGSIYNQNGFQTLVRLVWTPDLQTRTMASYDSRAQIGEVSGTRNSETQGVGSWSATADAQVQPENRDAVNGSVSYAANRANVTVAHTAGLAGVGFDGASNVASTEERTSVSVASSLVYADGSWGVGRPVTNSFALVTPHQSLEGSPVVLGGTNATVAQTDILGPAVVPNLAAYRQTRLQYDAPGAPSGYDLGSANFDINSLYRAGYTLQVGSAYTVTAMGTLQDANGEPIPLLAGVARETSKPDGRKVELFTNRAGRFGAQGLAPGRWVIELPTEPEPTRYVIVVPEQAKGLYNAGELKPSAGANS
jgi:outer membrane usher protein